MSVTPPCLMQPTDTTQQHVPPRIPVGLQLGIATAVLVLVFGVSYLPGVHAPPHNVSVTGTYQAHPPVSPHTEQLLPFEHITLEASSAFVWDVSSQRALYNKNADERRPLASLTKLMTALVAYELLASDSVVPITIEAIRQEGESGFSDGEAFKAVHLLDFMLLSSSNDGAHALAAAAGETLRLPQRTEAFVRAMNIRAQTIGLSQTSFSNATGLDISETQAGAYGSARDAAFLMEYIVTHYPQLLEMTAADTTALFNTDGAFHFAENTNGHAENTIGIIGSKTGYTPLAGGNLALSFNAGLNRPVVIVVLGSTRNGRFTDAATLLAATQATLAR